MIHSGAFDLSIDATVRAGLLSPVAAQRRPRQLKSFMGEVQLLVLIRPAAVNDVTLACHKG
jgi:hypothetical protein